MTTEAELRKLSKQLRRRGSDALQAPSEYVPARIRRLLALVENHGILRQEIEAASEPERDALEILGKCTDEGVRLPLPDDEYEHLGLLHQLLRRLADEDFAEDDASKHELWQLCFNYAGKRSAKPNEGVRELLDDAVLPYMRHLEDVVSNAILEADGDGSRAVSVEVRDSTGTMVNVGGDGASIHAHQEVRAGAEEVIEAAGELMQLAHQSAEVAREERQELYELASQARFEVQEQDPDRGKIGQLAEKLQGYADRLEEGTELAIAVWSLATSLAKFGGLLGLGSAG